MAWQEVFERNMHALLARPFTGNSALLSFFRDHTRGCAL